MLQCKLPYRIFWSQRVRISLLALWITCAVFFFCLQSTVFDIQRNTNSVMTPWSESEMNIIYRPPTNSILDIIKEKNEAQVVRNLDKFGPITEDSVVIVVQANTRKIYLKALIESLKDVKFVNESLLIFSHGFYSDEINKLVESIDFAKVLQIFFPYSLQTHINTFPGFTPGDCPHDVPKDQVPKNCFGKQRNFNVLQVKHHWWWKANTVFNKLRITRNFGGPVLFLEEDHYLFPDILHMLKKMREVAVTKCPDCNVFGVGQPPYPRGVGDYQINGDKTIVQQWNNMGFAFTREYWKGFDEEKCVNTFCEYNDYNWDFTVAYMSHKCLPAEIKPLNVISPRVFHIGDCGVHYHGTNCSQTKSLNKTRLLQKQVAQYLFPMKITVVSTNYQQRKIDGRNGGWDDARDIQLCKDIHKWSHS